MASGSGRGGFRLFLLLLVAWSLMVSMVAAVAQVDDVVVLPEDDGVVVDPVDEGLLDPGLTPPSPTAPLLRLPGDVSVDDEPPAELVPVEGSPIVVDDALPELPVWEGNPEADRPGLTVGVSEVVVDAGAKRAVPSGSAVSFEVDEKAAFPESVRFVVETFGPELAGDVSVFDAAFRVDASVAVGELVWDSPVDVVLDFGDLPVLHGAGAASRLEFELLEGCTILEGVVKGDETVVCKDSTRLESSSNPTARVLRASLSAELLGRVLDSPSRVEAFDLSGGGFSMLAVTSGPSGSGGDFAAAPLQTVSSWDVGLFSGAAETSYPIELPPAAVGPTPSIMLSYSSAAIDGMHEFSNNQVGAIGAGWSYTPGYITRHLEGCATSGHLCDAGDEYSIVLNGVSSRLVLDSSNTYRVQDDPNWLVTRKADAPAGHPDARSHYWEVTAKDGTKYVFGLTNDAAQTIPLGGGADHVYQWDLSEIVDTNGTKARFFYGQEFNYYSGDDRYVQSSHLEEIRYSYLGSQPSLRVKLNHEMRCGDATTTFGECDWPSAFVDTPTDLWCPSGSGCAQLSPTFWTALRLGSIQVQTLRDSNGDRWSTLALYDLAQMAPTPTDATDTNEGDPDDSDPRLLLYQILRRPEGAYTYNAYQQIEAEHYTYHSGVFTNSSDDVGGGDDVVMSAGDHISLHETEFEQGASEVIVRVKSSYDNQELKVYDSFTGNPVATIDVDDTSSEPGGYATVSATVTGSLANTESVYVKFFGTGAVDVNWIRFKPALDGGDPAEQDALRPVDYSSNWQWLGNRKNHETNGTGVSDGLAPMVVARIGTITNEYGGQVTFGYLDDGNECVEWPTLTHWKDNVHHCFPVNAGNDVWITFLKWVVEEVTVYDPVLETTGVYDYAYGTPRWAKNISPTVDLCDTSWDVPRGHSWVQVENPLGLKTKTWFYQGINGDLANCNGTERTDPPDELDIHVFGENWRDDEYWLVGRPAGSITYDTLGSEFNRTETFYTSSVTAGSGARDAARFIGTDRVITTTTEGSTSRDTRVSYWYDSYGNVTKTYYHGDLADADDNRYVETSYVYKTSNGYIVDRPKESKVFDVGPGGDTEIGRTQYLWDTTTNYGAAPTKGHLKLRRDYWGSGSGDRYDTEYTYDSTYGRVTSMIDDNGDVTTYYYDNVGSTYGRLVHVKDAADHHTYIDYDSYFRVESTTDARGHVTSAERDEYGRVTEVTAPGSATNAVEYEYVDTVPGRLVTTTPVDGNDVVSHTYVDGFGQPFQTQTASPTPGQRVITTAFTDDTGLLRYQSEPFEISGSPGSAAFDPSWTTLPLWHRYSYDTQGNQSRVETLINNTFQWDTRTETDGWWKTTFTDPNSTGPTDIKKVYFSDAFGNTTQIDEKIDSVWETTTYDYDKANRLRFVTDTENQIPNPIYQTVIDYDWLGRKKSIDDPDMGTWTYEYDGVGNLTEQTDGRGDTLSFEYDSLGRLIERYEGESDDINRTLLAEWSYYAPTHDYAGLLEYSIAFDSSFGDIEQHYDAYDNGGRLTDQSTEVPGAVDGTFRTQWSYDLTGNPLTITYPGGADGTSGEEITYDYNTLGQLDELDGTDPYVVDAEYNYWGAVTGQTLGTGTYEVAREFWYHNERRLYGMEAGTGGSTSNLFEFHLSRYDNNGNITIATDVRNSTQRQCFYYDANRLTRAHTADVAGTPETDCQTVDTDEGVGGYDHTYTYDAIGNLKTRTDITGTYNYSGTTGGPHAVNTIGTGYTFVYDGNGNQTTRTTPSGTQTLAWTPDNRLESVTEGTDVTEFHYDADGNRIVRVAPDATTVYIGGLYEYEIDDETGVNLVPNTGFETTSNWTESVSASLGESTSHHRDDWGIADNYSGDYGRTITNVAYGTLESDPIEVEAGHQYDVYGRLRGEIDSDDSRGPSEWAWMIRTEFYSDPQGTVSLDTVNADIGTPSEVTTTYGLKGGRVQAPTNAESMRVQLFFYNGQGWLAFDDFSVEDTSDPGVELLDNGSFETASDWTEIPSGALGEATSFYRGTSGIATPYTGSYSWVITNLAYGYSMSDYEPVTEFVEYDVYAWVRGLVDIDSSYGTNWVIRARWYDDQNQQVSYSNADYGPGSDLTTSWQHLGDRLTAPEGATQVRIQLAFYYSTGWIAFDDVTVTPAAGGSNILEEPGFETSNGWTNYTSSSVGEATNHWRGSWGIAEPYSGTYAYTISNTAYGWLTSDEIEIEGGVTYDLSAMMRGRIDPEDSRDGTTWILRATWYDTHGTQLGYDNTAGGSPNSIPATWDEVGGTATAPEDATDVVITIFFYLGSGWINFDDITLAKTPTETLYYPFNSDTVAMRKDGELYWMFTDHLGSIATTYKADGTETLRQYYHPYGTLRGATEPTIPTDTGYTGQTLDASTDLMFYNARYYDPHTGRFISADTIIPNPMDPQDLNRYSYVGNNPVLYNDPTGHGECLFWWEDDANGCFGGGVADVVTGTLNPIDGCLFQKSGNGCAGTDPRDYWEAAKGAADVVLFVWLADELAEYFMETTWDLMRLNDGARTPDIDFEFDWIAPSPGYEDEFGVGGGAVGVVGLAAAAKRALTSVLGRWSATSTGGATAVGPTSSVLRLSSRQLQAKWKHAADFGVQGNYNPANAVRYSEAINQHINSPLTTAISGTYRGNPVTHYLDPSTGLNVIADPAGTFISGWRLGPQQLLNVLTHGGLN